MNSSLLSRLDQCPPFLVYYTSHLSRGKRFTVDQLVAESKLPRRTFTRTARKLSWGSVKVRVMERFCSACGVNLLDTQELFTKLGMELKSDQPFQELKGHRRRTMLAQFNLLSAKAAMARNGRG